MRIGVLGGAFDPFHAGHLIVVQEVFARLALDRLILVPTGVPWHKSDGCHAPAEDRVAMVAAAVGRIPGVEVSRVDVDRAGPTYTIDTLSDLRREFGEGNDWFVIVGADALASFDTWRDPAGILALAHVIGVTRPGVPAPEGGGSAFTFIEIPAMDVSSTHVRELIAEGEAIDGLVPHAVAEYIATHHLYRRG